MPKSEDVLLGVGFTVRYHSPYTEWHFLKSFGNVRCSSLCYPFKVDVFAKCDVGWLMFYLA